MEADANIPLNPDHKKIVCLSDLHIGANISRYDDFKDHIDALIKDADHVVLNGDVFELFYLYKPKGVSGKEVVGGALENAMDWLEEKLAENPNRQIDFVIGNHENLGLLRPALEGMRMRFEHNLHWSEEAIALGDMLFVHGDLQFDKITSAARGSYTLKQATSHRDHTRMYDVLEEPGFLFAKSLLRGPQKDADKVTKQLAKRAEAGDKHEQRWRELIADEDHLKKKERKELDAIRAETMTFQRYGSDTPELLTTKALEEFNHICFGHTHCPFQHVESRGKRVHNTGALVRTTTPRGQQICNLHFLVCEMDDGGTMHNIHASGPAIAKTTSVV